MLVSCDFTYVSECFGFHLMMTKLVFLDAFNQALDSKPDVRPGFQA